MHSPVWWALSDPLRTPSRTERLTLRQVRESACLLELEHGLFPGVKPAGPQMVTISSALLGVSSPTLQNLGLLSLYNHMTQFLITYIVYIYMWVCIFVCVCAHACLHAWSCLTLCNPMDCSPPGSSVHGIFQARILE